MTSVYRASYIYIVFTKTLFFLTLALKPIKYNNFFFFLQLHKCFSNCINLLYTVQLLTYIGFNTKRKLYSKKKKLYINFIQYAYCANNNQVKKLLCFTLHKGFVKMSASISFVHKYFNLTILSFTHCLIK